MKERVIISACLLGADCKYDGGNCFAVFKNVFNDYYAKDTSKKIRAVV